MKSFFFLSFLANDMGKKGKGAESGRRTQEHRRTRARLRVRVRVRDNVADTLASFSGSPPSHRSVGVSEVGLGTKSAEREE